MIKYIHDAMAAKREALGKNDKGFSLIELLVVVLILGILAAIAIPVFIGQQDQANDSAAKANLANAKVAAVSYLVNNSTFPTPTITGTAMTNLGWQSGTPTVTIISASGTSFCFSAPGGGTNVWYVTHATNATTTACT